MAYSFNTKPRSQGRGIFVNNGYVFKSSFNDMKTNDALRKYFKKRTKHIDSLIRMPAGKLEIEDYHILHVEIKKLHALFKMLSYCSKKFKRNNYYKLFKYIFRQCGEIRELQLEETMIKKHDPHHLIKKYPTQLKSRLKDKESDFYLMANKRTAGKLKGYYKEIISYIKGIQSHKATDYIRNRKRKVKTLLEQKIIKIVQVHQLRKLLKEYYYNLKSIDLKSDGKVFKKGNDLQELMGKWHDNRIIHMHLNKALSNQLLDTREVNHLIKISLKILYNSEMLFRKINAKKNKVEL